MNILNLIQQKSEDDTILRNLLEENQRLLKREAERLKHQAERKRKYREKVKNKQIEDEKKLKQPSANTRTAPKITMIDHIIDDFLRENVIKSKIENRSEIMNERIRSVIPYSCKKKKGKFDNVIIISFKYNDNWIDWLEVKREGSDPDGFGLFACQYIREGMMFSVYDGIKKDVKPVGHQYAVQYNLKKESEPKYLLVDVSGKTGKWIPCKDEIYCGGHMINNAQQNNDRKPPNAWLDNELGITAKRDIKAGEEILINYNYDSEDDTIHTGRRKKKKKNILLEDNKHFLCEV